MDKQRLGCCEERNHKIWAIEVKSGKRGMNKCLFVNMVDS